MKRIALKLTLFFMSLIFISSILSFGVSTFSTREIKDEIRENQMTIIEVVRELNEKTDLSIEEIIDIASTAMYDVKLLENIDGIDMKNFELSKIEAGEAVFLSRTSFEKTNSIVKIGDHYLQVSLYSDSTIMEILISRVWVNIIAYLIIGSLLISITSRYAVKPILELNEATKKVGKGNFNVEIINNSKDEIGELTDNFNKMVRELKSIEVFRNDFISNVSHEFKTPLASIKGFTKLLENPDIDQLEKKEYISIILEETERLSKLSSNILKISKLENQEIHPKKEKFFLDEEIRKSILLLEGKWSEKNIEFDIELEKIPYIGDSDLLRHIWINLIENGIKFSEANGKIKIDGYIDDDKVKILIRDYGIGISEDNQKRIFEKFYQGEKSRSKEGNGLGLALVQRIIELYSGQIEIESKLGEGTLFSVKLPLEKI